MRPISPLFVSWTLCVLVAGPARAAVDLVARANPMSETTTVFPNAYSVSRDGRFVAYISRAKSVLPGPSDENNRLAVFLRDRFLGVTTLVSRAPGPSSHANGNCFAVWVSADGSTIVFYSEATNLTPEGAPGMFLFHRVSGTTTHLGRAGSYLAISADGSLTAYVSRDGPTSGQVMVFDRTTQTRALISHKEGSPEPAEGSCWELSMSADGRFVAFVSNGTDLVAGTLPGANVYLHDRATGANVLVSRSDVQLRASSNPLLSADGRYLAFRSSIPAPGLVPGTTDTNERSDAFLYDRMAGTTRLLSRRPGTQTAGDRETSPVAISADGELVLLWSAARDLVAMDDDPREQEDVFLFHRSTGVVELVSHLPGEPTKAIGGSVQDQFTMSDDGGLIAFASLDTESLSFATRMWVFERARQDVRPMSFAGYAGISLDVESYPRFVVSGDGRGVVFSSYVSNLGVGIRDFDAGPTLYGWDASTSHVEPLSVAGDPSQAALVEFDQLSISGNGRFVAFRAIETNAFSGALAPPRAGGVAVIDRVMGRTDLVNWSGSRNVAAAEGRLGASSGDGSTIFFRSSGVVGDGLAAPPSGAWFAFDVASGAISLVSRTADPRVGAEIEGTRISVSDDGRFATFESRALDIGAAIPPNGLSQVFLWSRDTGALELVSRSAPGSAPGDGNSSESRISADGSTIAFVSRARNLIAPSLEGEPVAHVYLYDRVTGHSRLVTRAGNGQAAASDSGLGPHRVLSADGRYLLFHSRAQDVGGLSSQFINLYRFDRQTSSFARVSHAAGSVAAALDDCANGEISRDGHRVAFLSRAPNLVPEAGDLENPQVFLFDMAWPDVRLVSRWSDGTLARANCSEPRLSANGSTVAFNGCAFQPGLGDTETKQAFVYEERWDRLLLASHAGTTSAHGNDATEFALAVDDAGDTVLFVSTASNLGTNLGATDLMRFPSERKRGLFAFSPPPAVSLAAPACVSATGGRTVAIQGGHFQPGATVTLDGVPAQVASVSSTEIVATAGARPAGPAHTGHIVVTNPNGEYFALGNAFTYALRGDANNSGALSAADGFFLAQAVFLGGPQPASLCNGDANGSGAITSADSFFLNLHLFLGGAPPPP